MFAETLKKTLISNSSVIYILNTLKGSKRKSCTYQQKILKLGAMLQLLIIFLMSYENFVF